MKRRAWKAVFCASLLVAVFAMGQWIAGEARYSNSMNEYSSLRAAYGPGPMASEKPTDSVRGEPALNGARKDTGSASAEGAQPDTIDEAQGALLAINPDYIGWIAMEDGGVDYPVVQYDDNKKYLNTTFEGKRNALGAIFMDYRNPEGFDGEYAIIYGHNAKNGTMFGSLKKLVGMEQYPDIHITTVSGEALVYQVFDVRKTDIHDAAFRWKFEEEGAMEAFKRALGAPEGTTNLMTLSTCTSGGSDDERLLVIAARVSE